MVMNAQEYMLVALIEECNEIAQAASKCLRFGLKDHGPFSELNNLELLQLEVNDFYAIKDILEDQHNIMLFRDPKLIEKKKIRFEDFKKYATDRGCLNDT